MDAVRIRKSRFAFGLIGVAALVALCLLGRQCRPDTEPELHFAPSPESHVATVSPSQEQPARAAAPVRRRIERTAAAPPVETDDGRVVVRVLDSEGNAAAGAQVRLQGWSWRGRGDDGAPDLGSATADAQGEVRMSVRAGAFVASASLGPHAAASGPHDSPTTREVVLHLELGVTYSVRPEDDDGQPIPGVRVEVRVLGGAPVVAQRGQSTGASAPDGSRLAPCWLRFTALTDEDGVARFPTLPAHDGGCDVTTVSEKEGHRAVVTRGRKEAEHGRNYEGRPYLLEAATFTGRLLSSDGTALTDIKFIVGLGQQFQAQISEDGTFDVPNSPRRVGVARVWSEGHAARQVSWDPSSTGTIDLGEIRLLPTRR